MLDSLFKIFNIKKYIFRFDYYKCRLEYNCLKENYFENPFQKLIVNLFNKNSFRNFNSNQNCIKYFLF